MAKPSSQASECWPDDPDWLDGAVWIDTSVIGNKGSGCFFDASLLDDAGQLAQRMLDVDQSLRVHFRVETRSRSMWTEVSGTWSFDLYIKSIEFSSPFKLSERVGQSVLQVAEWSGKDANCVEVAVNLPPGTLPGWATSAGCDVSATMRLQPTSGVSKPIAVDKRLGFYVLFSQGDVLTGELGGTQAEAEGSYYTDGYAGRTKSRAERQAQEEAERQAQQEAERQASLEAAKQRVAWPKRERPDQTLKRAPREAEERVEAEERPGDKAVQASAPPPLAAYDKLVRSAFADLVKPGRLLFNPPDRMQFGKTERVEVRLTRTLELDTELLEHLRGPGKPQMEEIPTAPLMAVTLKGEAFQITAYSDEEQSVTQDKITTWEFDIRGLKRGSQRLVMCVSLRIPVPGQPLEHKSIPVREAIIDVQVGAPALVAHFMSDNWQWFIGTAIAIAAVLVAVLFH